MRLAAIAALCLMLLPAGALARAASTQPATTQAVELAVVHTWGELSRQPMFTLNDYCKAQLGIEATHTPQGAGVLLYALVQGAGNFDPSESDLGPFRLGIAVKDQVLRNDLVLNRYARRRPSPNADKAAVSLFVFSISPPNQDAYRVMVSWRKLVFATATIAGDEAVDQPWYALADPRPALISRSAVSDEILEGAAFDISRPAIPIWEGTQEVSLRSATQPTDDEKLPTYTPAEPLLKLAVENDFDDRVDLVVHSPNADFFGASEHLLLMRYWVNGKPIAKRLDGEAMNSSFPQKLTDRGQPTFRLRVRLDPAVFGAKSGDTLGVQICACHDGWKYWKDSGSVYGPTCLRGATPSVEVSNRVDIKLP